MMLSIIKEELSKSEVWKQEKTAGPVDADQDPGERHELLETEVLTTDHEFDTIKEEWNQLLERSNAHIFQSYEWQRLWWKFFGDKCQMHIITFRNNGKLAGIAPLALNKVRFPGFGTYRSMRFMASYIPPKGMMGSFASYSPSDYLDIIVDAEYQEDVARTFVHYLKENKLFIDQVNLDELAEDGFTMQYVIPKIGETKWVCKQQESEACPKIELPETIRDYLYVVKASFRHKLRRSRRPVTEDNLYKVRDVKDDQDFEVAFQKLVDLHQERWNKQGYPGVFIDDRYERFIKSVCKAFLHKNCLRMKGAFDHDGNCLAVDLAFNFKDQYYDYQKALDVTSELAKEAPGHALTYFLIEDAINEKKKIFDLLRGAHRYKQRLSTTIIQNWKVTLHKAPEEQTIMDGLYKWINHMSGIRLRIAKELMLLRIYIREWGITGFIPKYVAIIKGRFENKMSK